MRIIIVLIHVKRMKIPSFIAPLLAAVGALACATKHPEFSSLMNQGPIPVSATSAFVASNLFLAREIERSTYLYNFFGARGGPQAVELIRESTWEYPQVNLYYPKKHEMYVARATESNTGREWMVRGPYRLDRDAIRTLAPLADVGEPVFDIFGKEYRFRQVSRDTDEKVIVPIVIPTSTPQPAPRRSRPRSLGAANVPATPTPKPPSNFDQQALAASKSLAERDASGQLIHTVKPGQTLPGIAAWYTGSSDNSAVLGQKNGVASDAAPSPGTRIVIPAELVKNPRAMGK
jgi:hypothetical protein